jgi:hypothetical protein
MGLATTVVSTPTWSIQVRDRPIDLAHHRRVAAGGDRVGGFRVGGVGGVGGGGGGAGRLGFRRLPFN